MKTRTVKDNKMFVFKFTDPLHQFVSHISQTPKSNTFLRSKHGSWFGPTLEHDRDVFLLPYSVRMGANKINDAVEHYHLFKAISHQMKQF